MTGSHSLCTTVICCATILLAPRVCPAATVSATADAAFFTDGTTNCLHTSGGFGVPDGTVPEPGALMFAVVGLAWLLVAPRGRALRLELLPFSGGTIRE